MRYVRKGRSLPKGEDLLPKKLQVSIIPGRNPDFPSVFF
jgi:hypothetical protein